jgi:hypothetical protein
MHHQLASWIGDIIAAVSLLLTIFFRVRRHRGRKTVTRFRHWKGFGIERTRLDVIDDRQL